MAKKEKDKFEDLESSTPNKSLKEVQSTIPVITFQLKDRKKEPNSEKIKFPLENLNLGTLVSRLDYTVSVNYGESKINVPPRAVMPNVDKTKLGVLPKNVEFKSSNSVGR